MYAKIFFDVCYLRICTFYKKVLDMKIIIYIFVKIVCFNTSHLFVRFDLRQQNAAALPSSVAYAP